MSEHTVTLCSIEHAVSLEGAEGVDYLEWCK